MARHRRKKLAALSRLIVSMLFFLFVLFRKPILQAERLLRFTDELQATIGREDSYFENEGLDEAKSLLTQKQIQVLLLRIEGYTNAQIARMTGVTKRAIEKRFSRIRKVCKEIGN